MLSDKVRDLIVSDEQQSHDMAMVPHDIWGTRAHVAMLASTKIISAASAKKICTALDQIQALWEQDGFKIDASRGTQLTLERYIVEIAGEQAGLSTHTARSRNDQVMTAEALYLRDQALHLYQSAIPALKNLLDLAGTHTQTVMPGYTHMQPGKPTTFAHWCLAYHDSLARGLNALQHVLTQYDKSPLGAVESFGTSWPIDRAMTAELLGFSQVWEVPQDAISHRGMFQVQLLGALAQIGFSMSKLATDVMLYSSWEYNILEIGDAVAQRMSPLTGSSVMPQKRNPDAFELLRSIAPQINGLHNTAFALLDHLPSGYNRDSREVKPYAAKGLKLCRQGLEVLAVALTELRPNVQRMKQLVRENYSLTTDIADAVAQDSGIPYRQAHKIVGKLVDQYITKGLALEEITARELMGQARELGIELTVSDSAIDECRSPELMLERRRHIGGTNSEISAAMVARRGAGLKELSDWHQRFAERVSAAQARTTRLCQDF